MLIACSLSVMTVLLMQLGQQIASGVSPAAIPPHALSSAAADVPSTPAVPTVTLSYNHPQAQPASYVLIVREDGSGHFHSDPLKTPASYTEGPPPTPLDADIWISQPLRDRLFEVARGQKVKSGNCDDAGSKIAFQGTKRLIYEGPAGRQECEFNWSRDKQIQTVAEQLQAVAQTLEAGRRIEVEHMHDRLGLDAELESLSRLVAEGQAAEIANIAPELRELANDPAVLDRVRRRARALLEEPAK
jgi:hypothetical protein